MTQKIYFIAFCLFGLLLSGCDLSQLAEDVWETGKEWTKAMEEKAQQIEVNGFSLDDDRRMGKELYAEMVTSGKHKVLDQVQNKELYDYLESIKNKILKSNKIQYRKDFEWKITVMDDDKTVNAFCAPGGYIFVYTGILKYLKNEAELAGVMAHEIAHADLRHGTRQLTKQIGIEIILGYLLDGQYAADIAAGLLSLRYSRMYERQADQFSVKYLCRTDYNAAGGAGFFEKIKKESGGKDEFDLLSTHPDSGERIENYKSEKASCGCRGTQVYEEKYRQIVSRIKQNGK